MLRSLLIAGAATCAVAAPPAARAAEAPRLSLTVYNSDLALVEDVRNLDIPAGRSKLEFKDVSAAIHPETVALTAQGVSIVEQNFDYDLLSPDKLMEKAVGRQVRIVRTNPGTGEQVTETATVLAVNEGVVLKIGDRIEVLRDDGVPTRVIFDKVPDNLRASPTLSVTVDSATAGPREAKLSYLTTGLSWKADYVALFDAKAGKLDLQGWITLTNKSGTSFNDAETRLVAGEINLTTGDQDYDRQQRYRARAMGVGGVVGNVLGDTYVYPLQGRTTIAQNQTKQIGFLELGGVAASKRYKYRGEGFSSQDYPRAADVVVHVGGGGPLPPLPRGIMRVYIRDNAGDPKFVGESAIDDAGANAEIPVKIGEAFDVTVTQTLVSDDKASKTRGRYQMSYLVRNARPEAVNVEVVQEGLIRGGRVVEESLKSRRPNASSLAWDVPVPAAGETTLSFTIDNGR